MNKQERLDLAEKKRVWAMRAMLSRDLNLFERLLRGEKTSQIARDYGLTQTGVTNAILRRAQRMVNPSWWGDAVPDRFYPGLTRVVANTPDDFRKLELEYESAANINYIIITSTKQLLQYPEWWSAQIRQLRWKYRIPTTI